MKFSVYVSINRPKSIHTSNFNSSFLIHLVDLKMKLPFLADTSSAAGMGSTVRSTFGQLEGTKCCRTTQSPALICEVLKYYSRGATRKEPPLKEIHIHSVGQIYKHCLFASLFTLSF